MSTATSGLTVTLYGKPDCSLCDELKADLLAMQQEIGFSFAEHNIEEDGVLFERFRYLIPVLEINDRELIYPPHTWSRTYNALHTARR